MGMVSKELQELDRNSVELMVEEMQKDLDNTREELRESKKELEITRQEIEKVKKELDRLKSLKKLYEEK